MALHINLKKKKKGYQLQILFNINLHPQNFSYRQVEEKILKVFSLVRWVSQQFLEVIPEKTGNKDVFTEGNLAF